VAVLTKYANAHTAITTGYTNPTNAYADDGTNYATAAPGAKNTEVSAYWGFPAFSTSDIPDGSTINSITVEHEFKTSTTSSIATEYIQVFVNTEAVGSEQSNASEPATDTRLDHQVTTGVTLANLRTADVVRARTRSLRGNSATAVTFSLDFVRITVDYTPSTAHTKDLADTITFSDNNTKSIGYSKSLADNITFSDDNTKQVGLVKVLSDTITFTDNESSEAAFNKSLDDTITFSDNRTSEAEFNKSLADSITFSDNESSEAAFNKSLADTITFSDSESHEISIQVDWSTHPLKKYNGSAWVESPLKYYTGSAWEENFLQRGE